MTTDTGMITATMTALADAVRKVTGRTDKMSCEEMRDALIVASIDEDLDKIIDGSIEVFEVPDNVTTIGDSAFYSCTSLTSVTIPNSVITIGDSAFYSCTSLTSITIPNSVITIEPYAFSKCTSLTSIMIPDSVTRIGFRAFYRCTSLTSITIPNSITTIGDDAFDGCTSLTKIRFRCSESEAPSGFPWGATNATAVYNYTGE